MITTVFLKIRQRLGGKRALNWEWEEKSGMAFDVLVISRNLLSSSGFPGSDRLTILGFYNGTKSGLVI